MKAILLEPTHYENKVIAPGEVELPAWFIRDNKKLFAPLKRVKTNTKDKK